METVTSKDGTRIAYDRTGQGPAVILVDGALCYRGFGPMAGLAAQLAPHFTVITYDRRGRGESSDTQPYAIEREVELGGHLHLGLEFFAGDRTPTNVELVEEAVAVCDRLSAPVATCAEAAALLGLPARP